MIKKYTHQDLGQVVESISGSYCIDKEELLKINNEELLYAIGNAKMDTSCCGVYGCLYAMVAGYVLEWKKRCDKNGQPISVVRTVADADSREKIIRILKEEESVAQVEFW